MGNQCQILYTSPSVVFITSIAGFQPQGSMAVYGVTKTALLGLTKRWALNDSFEASVAAIEGHDILMATMLNGAAMMDGVLLLIAADETCPPDEIDAYAATETVTEELPEVSPLDDTGAAFSTVTEELPEVNGTPEYLAAGSMSSISDIDTTIRITFSLKKVS